MTDFPKALPAPTGDVVRITAGMVAEAVRGSRQSPRRRIILPLHRGADESPHRMLNALQPGTYIRPHRHFAPPKHESVIVLRGAIGYLTFDESGAVTSLCSLAAGADDFGVDTVAGVYHTFVVLAPDTVLFEVKTGPYSADTDKDFAAWAPPEGATDCAAYLDRLAGYFS